MNGQKWWIKNCSIRVLMICLSTKKPLDPPNENKNKLANHHTWLYTIVLKKSQWFSQNVSKLSLVMARSWYSFGMFCSNEDGNSIPVECMSRQLYDQLTWRDLELAMDHPQPLIHLVIMEELLLIGKCLGIQLPYYTALILVEYKPF